MKTLYDELYLGQMVAVARRGNNFFFKRGNNFIPTSKGLEIIEADRKNGKRSLNKKHNLRGA